MRTLLSALVIALVLCITAAGQHKEPIRTRTSIDTFAVSVPKPMTATVIVQVQSGRRTQQVPRTISYVGWEQLIRVDTMIVETYAYDNYPDTVYGHLSTGQAGLPAGTIVPIPLQQATERTNVIVTSQYFDLKWRPLPSPAKFMQDARYVKPEQVK